MSYPMEVFLKYLMAESNAIDVIIEEDNASTEIPLPNLLLMEMSVSSEMSLSMSYLHTSSTSLMDSSSRWDSIPNIRGDTSLLKERRESIPSKPRRSLEEEPTIALELAV